jgi:hypothetical protein
LALVQKLNKSLFLDEHSALWRGNNHFRYLKDDPSEGEPPKGMILRMNGRVYVSLVAEGCERIGLYLESGDSHETEQ